jgi:DegV family protein with EDD domain
MAVTIVTDSVACLPSELATRYGITVVPLEIVYKDKVYKDGVDISASKFYEMLRTSKVLPTTTAPPPQVYLDEYEKIVKEGNEILVICPSKKLTHVYVSANVAADMLRERTLGAAIEVLDSGTAAGAQGFVALDLALASARKKLRLPELSKLASQIMENVHVLVFIDTIEYLARSGRVPYILAWANALLKIKPIIELLPMGKGVVPVDRVRTRLRALARVLEILEHRTKGLPLRVMVHHTNSPDEAAVLARQVKERMNLGTVYVEDFTPVMGVHTGPGLVGVSYTTYDVTDIEK